MDIKQLYNDNLRKLPNEYGDVSVMCTLIQCFFHLKKAILESEYIAQICEGGVDSYHWQGLHEVVRPYQLDESSSNFRGVLCICF